jgi:hypothetical protein
VILAAIICVAGKLDYVIVQIVKNFKESRMSRPGERERLLLV